MASFFTDIYYILKKNNYVRISDLEFSECISAALVNKIPFMAGRIGATEAATLRMIDFHYKSKQKKMVDQLAEWSGFFPRKVDLLPNFAEEYEKAISQSDVLFPMKYRGENYLISRYAPSDVRFFHDYSYMHEKDSWFKHLSGKKVLVIHPFAKTIKSQYENNRTKIHKTPNSLPLFELHVLKAVFTAAGEKDERFNNWFEALDYMHQETRKIDFDIALIGCGAYGLPLAARIKQDGKIAVHFGGTLQLVFGIKGARWDEISKDLYNEYWTYPDLSERPENFALIEGSSYWEPKEKNIE